MAAGERASKPLTWGFRGVVASQALHRRLPTTIAPEVTGGPMENWLAQAVVQADRHARLRSSASWNYRFALPPTLAWYGHSPSWFRQSHAWGPSWWCQP